MTHIVVLGAGRVGGAMAKDLAPEFKVTVADRSEGALARMRENGLSTRAADLSTPEGVKAAVADADMVVGAVPGFMGFATAKAVLEAGKTLVDISFFDEDCYELDALAKALHVPTGRLNDIVLERRGVTPDTALRLARYFGGDAQSWLNLQSTYDLKVAEKAVAKRIAKEIEPLETAAA